MKQKITIGDKYGPAMEITEQAEADTYLEECIQHAMTFGLHLDEAEDQERANLGYYAGYYDTGTRARVERLFRCKHPVFGSILDNGAPTAEEALEAGRRAAEPTDV